MTTTVSVSAQESSPDEALQDVRCLATTEAIVIDGANGVCGARRPGRRELDETPAWILVLTLAGLLALFGWWVGSRAPPAGRDRWTGWLRLIVVLVVVAAGVPGTYAVWAMRGDRPTERPAVAATIQRAIDRLDEQRRVAGCLGEPGGICVACVPLERIVGVTAPVCSSEQSLLPSLLRAGP